MTVLSRGARVRRGGRRPGWVLLTALLVLAMGASSALVFTNRVELLKLAVILALWAAVAGAFVSVLYRRQSDADQSRVRDLKLVYDLQLDREISARREYELTVESQLRRELASELRAQAADDLAALRAELTALRTSLEILFDTDLEHRPALGTHETETPPARAYSDWDRNGESHTGGLGVQRSGHVGPPGELAGYAESRTDESAIIDVPEEPLLPPRPQPPPREPAHVRRPPRGAVRRLAGAAVRDAAAEPPPSPPDSSLATRRRPRRPTGTAAQPQPPVQDWQPAARRRAVAARRARRAATGPATTRPMHRPMRRRAGARARHSSPDETRTARPSSPRTDATPYGESGRRARSRHSAEYRDDGVAQLSPTNEPPTAPPRRAAPAASAPRAAATARGAATANGAAAAARARTPASRRRPRGRTAGTTRATARNRWPVGRRPAGAAAGRAHPEAAGVVAVTD